MQHRGTLPLIKCHWNFATEVTVPSSQFMVGYLSYAQGCDPSIITPWRRAVLRRVCGFLGNSKNREIVSLGRTLFGGPPCLSLATLVNRRTAMRFASSSLAICAVLTSLSFFVNTAEAASQRECEIYARQAIQQFQLTQKPRFAQRCGVAPSPRWQTSYQNHYRWCLTAPSAWLKSEKGARDAHLNRCGAQAPFD
jgi:hypothetical protein